MTARIRVLVVDDEPLARSGLTELCRQRPDLEVVGECADGRAAVEAVKQLEPDLLLLDVQMPEMDGFEVLRAVGADNMPHVIFITAYDEFAVRAFEVNALDYILKPFDDERFWEAIERAKRAIRDWNLGELSRRLLRLLDDTADRDAGGITPRSGPADLFLTRIAIKDAGRVFFVRVDEIVWIEAANYYVKLHIAGKIHLLRESMTALEHRLDPARFFRVSRSAIVNLDRVRELQPFSRGSQIVILDSGARVKLSHNRRERLEQILGQSL
ncbi:MAG: hypothetical protein AMS18_00630 [Gemmatimonas sp. SG8_17]|nr:MAG: hypothetical protein AMS18_00630 [Gemmatimonas sp. SG8_17]